MHTVFRGEARNSRERERERVNDSILLRLVHGASVCVGSSGSSQEWGIMTYMSMNYADLLRAATFLIGAIPSFRRSSCQDSIGVITKYDRSPHAPITFPPHAFAARSGRRAALALALRRQQTCFATRQPTKNPTRLYSKTFGAASAC